MWLAPDEESQIRKFDRHALPTDTMSVKHHSLILIHLLLFLAALAWGEDPMPEIVRLNDGSEFKIVRKLGSGGVKDAYLAERITPPCPVYLSCKIVINRIRDKKFRNYDGPNLLHADDMSTQVSPRSEPDTAEDVITTKLRKPWQNVSTIENRSQYPYLRIELGEVHAHNVEGMRLTVSEYHPRTLSDLSDSFQLIPNLSPQQARANRILAEELYQAIQSLDAQGLVHRDVKIPNIFIRGDTSEGLDSIISGKSHLALGDFDLLTLRGVRKELSGAPNYFAPEILNTHTMIADKAQDLYASSLSLFQLHFNEFAPHAYMKEHAELMIDRPPGELWQLKLTQNNQYDQFLDWVSQRYEKLIAEQTKKKNFTAADDLRALQAMVINGLALDPKKRQLAIPHPLPYDADRARAIAQSHADSAMNLARSLPSYDRFQEVKAAIDVLCESLR